MGIKKKINLNFVEEKLRESKLKLFTVLDFQRIFEINYETAKRTISRYVKAGVFVRVKKGLYFFKYNPPFDFEIANKLYRPSYVSFDAALSYHHIIPETVYNITSATTRLTREMSAINLSFSYYKIKKECFFGYRPEKINNTIVLIADPEKALADYLYFIALGKRGLHYERIDLKKLDKIKILDYAKCFKNKKLLEVIEKLYAR